MTDLHDLAQLDPARHRRVSEEETIRGRAQLERTIATPLTPPVTARQQRTRRRIGVVSALAGGAAASAVLVTTTIGGTTAAYADWTPTPSHLSATKAVQQANDCAKSWDSPVTLDESNILLAEHRGDGTITLVQHDGTVRACSSVDPDVPTGWELLEGPGAEPTKAPAADGVRIMSVGSEGEGDKAYSSQIGRVGSDVAGVDVLTPDGRVEATIRNGWFVAWWPGAEADGHVDDIVVHRNDGTTA
ncbi:MAG: hypothetical protein ACRYG2_39080, partial [Janthinobacterium lividum]